VLAKLNAKYIIAMLTDVSRLEVEFRKRILTLWLLLSSAVS
jgi:hypothetical protein